MSDRTPGELPGLLAWGDELYAATALAERPSRGGRRRLVRRAGLALVLALLVVPVALATRHSSDGPGHHAGRGQLCLRPATFRGAHVGPCVATRSGSEP